MHSMPEPRLLFTSLCEGMSLEAKEFILAQPTDNPGVLIISLFSGQQNSFSDAIIINPYDVTETASAIHSAADDAIA